MLSHAESPRSGKPERGGEPASHVRGCRPAGWRVGRQRPERAPPCGLPGCMSEANPSAGMAVGQFTARRSVPRLGLKRPLTSEQEFVSSPGRRGIVSSSGSIRDSERQGVRCEHGGSSASRWRRLTGEDANQLAGSLQRLLLPQGAADGSRVSIRRVSIRDAMLNFDTNRAGRGSSASRTRSREACPGQGVRAQATSPPARPRRSP
jgi:hypothetical protein